MAIISILNGVGEYQHAAGSSLTEELKQFKKRDGKWKCNFNEKQAALHTQFSISLKLTGIQQSDL